MIVSMLITSRNLKTSLNPLFLLIKIPMIIGPNIKPRFYKEFVIPKASPTILIGTI